VDQYVSALRSGNYQAMINLSDPQEIKRARLTSDKLRLVLSLIVPTPSRAILTDPIQEPLNAEQSRYNYLVSARVQMPDGSPVTDSRGSPVRAYLYAYNTDNGWKVATTHLLIGTLLTRLGREGERQSAYAEICRAAGVASGYLEPTRGEWKEVTNRH
jgi:hypothetical protein